ncbi:mechanosensitive ion channel family protein [Saccharicrinis aurantiacus]|uniref:mechanosensitive ion channel family protein n=1 Tax=Saccharicrinis aurantiacus TaxID=1849719 RepID=UPI00094F6061|nr:mechanosensitive ion channel domain-containing protein [Saccharicrinis aurantiacus]
MKNIKSFILPVLLLCLTIALKQVNHFYPQLAIINTEITSKLLSIVLIISFTWMVIKMLRLIKLGVLGNFDIKKEDNLKSRRVYTQYNILENILIFVVIIVAIGFSLMLFDDVKKLGISLFASAGISTIIIGFAAQKFIGTVLAGIQIAITQPIAIDDVVIVENEWGWIEEINLTYVVVRIWDKRRLIVPTTYFIETPFQNWTRNTADILGTVFIYTDYTMDVKALREELTRLLESTDLWDKEVNVLQVTNATEQTMEVRALMSAKNSPTAWDLRVFIREGLITFIQENYPDALPKTRIDIPEAIEADPLSKEEMMN